MIFHSVSMSSFTPLLVLGGILTPLYIGSTWFSVMVSNLLLFFVRPWRVFSAF